jgi:hypothetical protein
MPGFLGGSSGSSGTGGEIRFPKEFIDPVTKLRISQPENLIDTDFEYGLQPTKWETVELINNTPSFFSKSGDTTIPGIASISTNTGTREITVVTATDHGLAVGIPINVTGTKSVTADGSYIINSIPNTTTFTYLCKDIQQGNNAIEDLYTSIITGEFFQGSQIRISDAEGIVTDGEATSTLTVKTDSTHGFGLNTPFYFLNLNSTISQEFEASNTAAKSFDSSNSATAQTFDGSNTLSTFNIDWSNSATVGGTTSTISGVSTVNDTIAVTHGAETFANRPLGTPLYYNLTVPASSGYFADNPRGVVFLKTVNALNNPVGTSTFQVSDVPDGDAIDIVSSMSGTFQLANQARTFAGNNTNPVTEATIDIIAGTAIQFDGANDGEASAITGERICTVSGYSGSLINVTTDAANNSLDYYQGAMLRYSTTGSAASGLTNNTTYFVDTFFSTGTGTFSFTIKNLPGSAGSAITSISGGTGTQKFTRIGVSTDKDIVHARNSNFLVGDLIRYTYPAGGKFTVLDGADNVNFYYVATAYDAHNYVLNSNLALTVTGGQSTYNATVGGQNYTFYRFTTVGSNNLVVSGSGTLDVLLVGGGGGGGVSLAGGGGGGAAIVATNVPVSAQTYTVVVGNGGAGGTGDQGTDTGGTRGGASTAFGISATGGGGAPNRFAGSGFIDSVNYTGGGNGGGGSADGARPGPGTGANGVSPTLPAGITGTVYAGFRGGDGVGNGPNYPGAGGAGSAQNGSGPGSTSSGGGAGGQGALINFDGNSWRWGGGGGGSSWCQTGQPGGAGGAGGGGGGASDNGPNSSGGGTAINSGAAGPGGGNDCGAARTGGAGGANSGGGGGAGSHSAGQGGAGGSGIVIVRVKV